MFFPARPGQVRGRRASLCLALLAPLLLLAGAAEAVADEKPRPKKPTIVVVSPGNNLYLDAFLEAGAIDKHARVLRLRPADLDSEERYRKPAREGAFDLVLFDRCGPEKAADLPQANTLFIGHPPPPWKVGAMKKREKVRVKTWDRKHPLLASVVLDEVTIATAFELKDLPRGSARLIEAEGGLPVVVALKRKAHTDLVMTFAFTTDKDEVNTNWVTQFSFPVFLSNVFRTLGHLPEPPP